MFEDQPPRYRHTACCEGSVYLGWSDTYDLYMCTKFPQATLRPASGSPCTYGVSRETDATGVKRMAISRGSMRNWSRLSVEARAAFRTLLERFNKLTQEKSDHTGDAMLRLKG